MRANAVASFRTRVALFQCCLWHTVLARKITDKEDWFWHWAHCCITVALRLFLLKQKKKKSTAEGLGILSQEVRGAFLGHITKIVLSRQLNPHVVKRVLVFILFAVAVLPGLST